MNENLDLVEILKDCPKGTKLYSTIFGDVELVSVYKNEEDVFPIEVKRSDGNPTTFMKNGRFYFGYDGECALFPSRDQRDWSKFSAPWLEKQGKDKKEINNFDVRPGLYKCVHRMFDGTPDGRLLFEIGNVYKCLSKHDRAEFEVFYGHSVYLEDPVVRKFFIPFESKDEQASSQTNERAWLYLVSDVLTWKDGIGQYLDDPRVQELAKILCGEYAQKLYNPSVLSNSSNTRKNGQKFDPNTLEPFDKVLARNDREDWSCMFFSHIVKDEETYPYACGYDMFTYCIPYNDDTKHLIGKAEEAPEYYRYWED